MSVGTTSPSLTSARVHRAGMTLVEILVVLTIVGVMAGITVLSVGIGDRGVSLESEANRLADRLRLASDETLVTRRPLTLVFDPSGYQFVRDVSAGGAEASEALRERHALPGGIRLIGLDVASPMAIDPDGATPVATFALSQGDDGWQVQFDGLNATVAPMPDNQGGGVS